MGRQNNKLNDKIDRCARCGFPLWVHNEPWTECYEYEKPIIKDDNERDQGTPDNQDF
jgi:hypothetical protein